MHLFHSGDRKQFPDSFMSETRRLWKVIHAKGVESRVQWKVKNKWVAQQKNRRRRKGDNFYFTYNPTRGLLASAPSISYSHSRDSARADGPWGAFLTRSGSAPENFALSLGLRPPPSAQTHPGRPQPTFDYFIDLIFHLRVRTSK